MKESVIIYILLNGFEVAEKVFVTFHCVKRIKQKEVRYDLRFAKSEYVETYIRLSL